MRFIILLFFVLNLLVAKTVYTPFDSVESMSISGKVTSQSYEIKNKWLKLFQEDIVRYLAENGFKKDIGKLYKKNTNISTSKIKNNKTLLEQYTILATNTFDIQKPTLKVMINYLGESYPDYKDMVKKRNAGIEKAKKDLLQEPLQISQQFFIYKNAYSGFDIAFAEQYTPLGKQEGGRLRVGVFDASDESYLFVEDKLSSKFWFEDKTKKTINKLKEFIVREMHSFYKPQELLTYKFVPKKQQVIKTENLVTTAISDDSDSSRVECDSDFTLNNENVTMQLVKIDTYINKIAPYNDEFMLPESREGVAWQSFYWKYKKIKLINKLSKLGEYEEEFLTLLTNFVKQEKYELKKLLSQEELVKIETLFNRYWTSNKIDNKQVEDFLVSVDIVDLIALGMR